MLTDRDKRVDDVAFDYGARETEPWQRAISAASTRLVEAARHDRYGYPRSLRVCARCGLGFLSPRLTAAEYGRVLRGRLPAARQRLPRAPDRRRDRAGRPARLRRGARRASCASTLPSPPATVLDVGGSTGIVAGAVRGRLRLRGDGARPGARRARRRGRGRDGDDRRLRRGLRPRRAALGPRAPLPDDRPPARRRARRSSRCGG